MLKKSGIMPPNLYKITIYAPMIYTAPTCAYTHMLTMEGGWWGGSSAVMFLYRNAPPPPPTPPVR
jgi:hypothetical protein